MCVCVCVCVCVGGGGGGLPHSSYENFFLHESALEGGGGGGIPLLTPPLPSGLFRGLDPPHPYIANIIFSPLIIGQIPMLAPQNLQYPPTLLMPSFDWLTTVYILVSQPRGLMAQSHFSKKKSSFSLTPIVVIGVAIETSASHFLPRMRPENVNCCLVTCPPSMPPGGSRNRKWMIRVAPKGGALLYPRSGMAINSN